LGRSDGVEDGAGLTGWEAMGEAKYWFVVGGQTRLAWIDVLIGYVAARNEVITKLVGRFGTG